MRMSDKNGIPDGSAIATTTTDANGNYFFDSLLVGNYIVSVIPPSGQPLSSTPTVTLDNNVDDDDNGIQTTSGSEIFSPSIELLANTEPSLGETGQGGTQDDANDNDGNMTIDFGLIPYVSIGSTVFRRCEQQWYIRYF